MAQPSKDIIEDITTRFILTAPSEQLEYFESLMFLVEQAWWYYEDNLRDGSALRSYNLRDFAELIFKNCPELRKHVGSLEDIMARFKEFKRNVPVMGAILLDGPLEHVLLVRGFKGASCWGFPRGKIMKDESDADCAAREVMEETGYDLEGALHEEDFIELVLEGKRNKLYIVAGLDPKSAQFAPKCKGEIGGYSWYRVADLPSSKEESNQQYLSADGSKIKFYAVWPFMKKLKSWIRKKNKEWDMPGSSQKGARPQAQQQQAQQQQQPQQQQQAQQPPAQLRGYDSNPVFSYSSYSGPLGPLLASAAAHAGGQSGAQTGGQNGSAGGARPPGGAAAAAAAVAAAAPSAAAAPPGEGAKGKPWVDFRLNMGPILACFNDA
ncbi:mRNA-decapping enzyme subunit [Raphidocelis subcapitata]|uniref:mRNA-decapping enzyme subunit n=1 Tax=Raphidocelis subcapitata TaxID=307507 RepID=A0A2V0P569_9CHLO|nr:mRNA-decapping enzyme subunit [Raphidocelis subcapitata]|eukprot:GBF94062.1 mRNA-decapping enzyme subunit [Raphidocelis subcapitata]